jgi:hypothetical protein
MELAKDSIQWRAIVPELVNAVFVQSRGENSANPQAMDVAVG